ncbi:MAG: hypothetical protein ACM3VT_12595 [Solirubrobacterales bacterium]
MTRQRILLAMLATGLVLTLTAGARADTNLSLSYFGHHSGIGVGIGFGGRIVAPEGCPPVYRHGYYRPAWRYHPMPPVVMHPPVVVYQPPVVYPPVVREVVFTPAPVVIDSPITVWITNSNGSKTSVKLTRDGAWYVGPRGEYYAEMPTNEQLRVVYGF